MSRESENIMLLMIGLATGMITVTGAFVRYVKPALEPWLYLTAVLLIGLALVAIIGDLRRPTGSSDHDHGHGQDDGGHSHANGAVWLLLIPVVVLIFVTPPALRPQASVPSISAVSADSMRRAFPPLPPGRAPEVSVPDLMIRGVQDSAGTLDGRLITVIGFTLRDGDAVDLGRFSVLCCAADARLARVRLGGSGAQEAAGLPEHSWVRVEGTVRPGLPGEPILGVPIVEVDSVTQIDAPENVYS
jgi:putative membrane protein